MFKVAGCVYLNLKVSDVTPKRWGYFRQSYILRFKAETMKYLITTVASIHHGYRQALYVDK